MIHFSINLAFQNQIFKFADDAGGGGEVMKGRGDDARGGG